MKNNRITRLCANCNSHVSSYRNEKGSIVSECQYCGTESDGTNPLESDLFDDE